ncbi:hypothetical protein CTheo_5223 [Ceratobasidium theobromae]|uniref:F-box domain-containing protein n=1 Tax=Ceratobasidium theobromae TaxID=1582974 RepID=A0A5N5QHZ3_9AGAM|nr:hypothetical protein CTheo_5223 [Ceratobasidium theobromae]
MPSQLSNLPPEVVSGILAYVHDPVDLAALTRVNSHIRFEATRALYATVKLSSLNQTVRFCRTIVSWAWNATSDRILREYPGVHVQNFTFRPRELHIEHPPVSLDLCPHAIDYTPRPIAAFFRLLSNAIAALPHLTMLDLAWGFLYRHTHPTWTLDYIGTHRYLRTFYIDGVEDANALERFLARHRPNETEDGCIGIRTFENRSWLDLLDPSAPRGVRVPKQFAPGLLPVAQDFAGPVSMLKSIGFCANNLKKVRVWSWGYGSAEDELAGIRKAFVGGQKNDTDKKGKKRSGCGVADFTYVTKTLIEDIITLAAIYLPDVVHLTIEGYEPGKTPLPERLPSLPNLETITVVARAARPAEKLLRYRPVIHTRDSLGDSRLSEITIPSLRGRHTAQPADSLERQEGYSKAWLECRRTTTPLLDRVTWRPGPKDFHTMGP